MSIPIDGYTQQGASPNTLAEGNDALLNVQLDGLNAGSGVDGFQIEAADTTIKGLVIRLFDDYGIQMSGTGATGNKVEGNFIGVNRDGITGRGNSIGVFINGGDDNTVGGLQPEMRNVISAIDEHGVFIGGLLSGGNENRVEGNYIGTTADGDADLGNAEIGAFISGASNNTLGGTAEGARNVISANEFGVFITGFQATENRVEGNYIGTGADSTGNLGNTEHGVWIFIGANFTTVGGTANGAGNRIAHNGADGVSISDSATASNNVISNTIFNNDELGIDLAGGTEDANGVHGQRHRRPRQGSQQPPELLPH